MAQIGDWEHFGIVVTNREQTVWQVLVDKGDTPIAIEFDAARGLMTFSTDLGAAEAAQIERVNALALDYAQLHAETGGARLARCPLQGRYALLADYAVQSLSRSTLGGVLRRFATMASGWREIVARGPNPIVNAEDMLRSHPAVIRA